MKKMTLDEILDQRDKNRESVYEQILDQIPIYKEKYPVLYKYDYVNNMSLQTFIEFGSIIRYSKNLQEAPSIACFVYNIEYDLQNGKRIKYLTLMSLSYNRHSYKDRKNNIESDTKVWNWDIYPENFFLFLYDKKNDDAYEKKLNKKFITKNYIRRSKGKKYIKVPQKINKLLTKEQCQNETNLSKKADKLINEYEKCKKERSEMKEPKTKEEKTAYANKLLIEYEKTQKVKK
jgi:hypothetical protein